MADGPQYVQMSCFETAQMCCDKWFHLIEVNRASDELVGSSSEILMCAFALGRWDEVSGWINDPWFAWFERLDETQRHVVIEWRKQHCPDRI